MEHHAKYGLLGRTLGHSFSVPIHQALGNRAYTLYPTEPEDIASLLADPDLKGLNVTLPYKETVLPYCQVLAPEVEEIGAANCLVRDGDTLIARNTDYSGFIYMTEHSKVSVKDKSVLVFGTGGSSKAIHAALNTMGAKEIFHVSSKTNTPEGLKPYTHAEVIVNCTPVGMYPKNEARLTDLTFFPRLSGVLDIVYNPLRTGIMMDAEEMQIPCAGGLSMLVAQAKAAHEYFFQTKVEDAVIDSIVNQLRCETENIIICGMPGSGKTSIANALGALTGREVIDTDAEIEKTAGLSIPDIFKEYGEENFRERESAEIAKYGKCSGKILSLGGGAVLKERNYRPLHQNGRIYQIQRNLNLLATDGRPLSKDLDTLKEMEQVRAPYYQRFADVIIPNDATVEDAAKQILEDFSKSN